MRFRCGIAVGRQWWFGPTVAAISWGMTIFIALLRAVNVGGTNKLPMSDLKRLCESAGFRAIRTYIASGNVVFESEKSESQIKADLEARLHAHMGKPVGVLVRTAEELAQILEHNPFPEQAPNRTVAIFLDRPPAADALENLSGRKDEQLRLGTREIYVHYGDGMGTSTLRIPTADHGTARNMNTVAKLAALATKA
jgi:uncharacterized protein (DUF1697 family)